MLRRAAFALAFALLPAALLAQSPAELAEREKQRREKQKGSPAPTFTNDDLARTGGRTSTPAAKPGARTTPAPAGEASAEDESRGSESEWRQRAAQARAEIKSAAARIKSIQERLNALMVDTSPTNVSDPFRLQTLEAEKAKARAELEKATQAKQAAEKALEDLQDEARRKSVPPGWLREP